MPVQKGPQLFKFAQSDKLLRKAAVAGTFNQNKGAPDLLNLQGFDPKTPSNSNIAAIDVINDFEWTHTPTEGRHEVPFMRLSEYRVNFNSLLQNIRYLLTTVQEDQIKLLQQRVQLGDGVIGKAFKAGTNFLSTVRKGISNLPGLSEIQNPNTKIQPYLEPYYGLYGATPTGFEYYLPYFEQNWKTVSNRWNDWTEGGGMVKNVYNKLFSKQGLVGDITTGALISPHVLGAHVERPKQYSYGADSPSINIKLELINTQSQEDVIKNWHFIFLLLYQNLPNKTSKLLLEPPVIYEAEIPGTFYSPFAYISDIKVTALGATRLMKVPYYIDNSLAVELSKVHNSGDEDYFERFDGFSTDSRIKPRDYKFDNMIKVQARDLDDSASGPNNNIQYIETIIPDAFSIDITLQSLIPESKNLFFHSILGKNTLNTGIFQRTSSDTSLRKSTVVNNNNLGSTARALIGESYAGWDEFIGLVKEEIKNRTVTIGPNKQLIYSGGSRVVYRYEENKEQKYRPLFESDLYL